MTNKFYTWLKNTDNLGLLEKILSVCKLANIYVLDESSNVLYWSQGMEQLTGILQTKAVGKPCCRDYCLDHEVGHSRLQVIAANGVKLVLKGSCEVITNLYGEIAGKVVCLTEFPEVIPKAVISNVLADNQQNFHGIISRSPAMQDVFQIVQNAAETEATVLVRGESGSGKELVAKAIHHLSARRKQPFLAVNCAALSSNLLESELFGHVKGAFTGAIKDHHGLFERAHGGTLFLDEVAELPLELQAKLLRVLQERSYIPVGGEKTIQVDVRIVAATHRSLREEVKLGHFREDLMYRLRVVPIFIPPLRERREDISLLIWHFIGLHNTQNFRRIDKIEPQAMRVLLDHTWPGNIRELHNVVEYAFAVGRGTTLRLSELPPEFREPAIAKLVSAIPTPSTVLDLGDEQEAMRQALVQSKGNINNAAKLMGMSRATFWRKRKEYGLENPKRLAKANKPG